jgi:hypothetical protein
MMPNNGYGYFKGRKGGFPLKGTRHFSAFRENVQAYVTFVLFISDVTSDNSRNYFLCRKIASTLIGSMDARNRMLTSIHSLH